MMFCKECGSILVLSRQKKVVHYVCNSCNFNEVVDSSHKKSEKISSSKKIEVLEDNNILATHNHTCSKCGYDKAELIEHNAWYADEDGLIQFKCGKCNNLDKAEGIRTK